MTRLFAPPTTSLKICGVTIATDAERLASMGVDAIGINFWSQSKRYINPEIAATFLKAAKGKILRVGVFVNAIPSVPRQLIEDGLIDVAQFHGDETPDYCAPFVRASLPFIKAIAVENQTSLENAADYGASAILLDTPAPGIYGGTGETFNWEHARDFIRTHPNLPTILAGGITPENAADAIAQVRPAALDIASGAELSPGIKDFDKVKRLLAATQPSTTP